MTIKKLPILYHEGKSGKLYSWKIWTEGPDICVEYGTVDGEKSTTRKTAKAKNVGKSNVRPPKKQAQFEAQAQWTKKQDKRYSTSKKKAKDTVFLPMLAKDYTKDYINRGKSLTYPVDTQPKLEGVRCMAFWKDDKVQLMSRSGKPFDVQHIKDEVTAFLPRNMVLDGELYVHGMSQQKINKLWKKHREIDDPECPGGSIQLEYRVYDGFVTGKESQPWRERFEIIWDLGEEILKTEHIQLTATTTVENEEDLFKELEFYEENGFEGVIIRLLDGVYNLGHRSGDLLKLKNFLDEEFPIVGHEEATGNDKGTVVWVCETKEGKRFNVRPTGSRGDRAAFFEVAERHYGRLLTVKFQSWTDDMKPYFGVGVALREPEDM